MNRPEERHSHRPAPAPRLDRLSFGWVTWLILLSTIAVFFWQLAVVHATGEDTVGDRFAFSREAWHEGRPWTVLTYAWVHAVSIFGQPSLFWLHITTNMLPLFCLGPALEDFLGRGRFLGLYVGGAIAGAATWWAFNPVDSESIMGASGAVFALIAGAGTAAPRARVLVFLFLVIPVWTSLRVLALGICGLEAAQAIFGWLPEVAHTAHLGGALFGFLYVGLLRGLSRWRWWSLP